MNNRRSFIKKSAMVGLLPMAPFTLQTAPDHLKGGIYEQLDESLKLPVLKTELFTTPVLINSVELLQYNGSFVCRVRSKNGAEGISISNNIRMKFLYPVFLQRVAPFFIGQNAVELDQLIEGVYHYKSNYKFQSYALWVPVATIEFAILDMLGKIAGKSMGELIGEIHNSRPSVYLATSLRDLSADQSLEKAQELIGEKGYRALKFKIGGRMGNNVETIKGRTEKLIALARKSFGDAIWLGVDANGGYTAEEAIRIGKMLEAYDYSLYEEPLPFDWYRETKKVQNALQIRVAGGEQEASMRNFRWMIGDGILRTLRPDMFYFGGMVRSIKVARMAALADIDIVPHLSGSGLGYIYAMHFLSVVPNAGPYNPLSRDRNAPKIPVECDSSSLKVEAGNFTVPTGPGVGVTIDPAFLKKHKIVENN